MGFLFLLWESMFLAVLWVFALYYGVLKLCLLLLWGICMIFPHNVAFSIMGFISIIIFSVVLLIMGFVTKIFFKML
jgi:hypothetical protein